MQRRSSTNGHPPKEAPDGRMALELRGDLVAAIAMASDALVEAVTQRVAEIIGSWTPALPEPGRLLKVKEVAVQLGISEKAARDLVNWKGNRPPRLASVVIGDGARRVEQAEVDRYLAEKRAARVEEVERERLRRTRAARGGRATGG